MEIGAPVIERAKSPQRHAHSAPTSMGSMKRRVGIASRNPGPALFLR
jgi:hypothetical protein